MTATTADGLLADALTLEGIGGLFFGFGGLDEAAAEVFGQPLAWYADVCRFDKDGNAGHYTPHRGPCAVPNRAARASPASPPASWSG